MILYLIVTVFTIIFAWLLFGPPLSLPSRKGSKELRGMSEPGRKLVGQYKALPVSSRPSYDVVAMVRALDEKYGVKQVTDAYVYMRRDYSNSGRLYHTEFKWNVDSARLKYPEYIKMHVAMNKISKAVAEREESLKLQRLSGRLSQVDAFVEDAHESATIIKDVTKELG